MFGPGPVQWMRVHITQITVAVSVNCPDRQAFLDSSSEEAKETEVGVES